tara:strand:+ start:283 stop:1272 length:990 start_codon:yes stop_codon:yes gene_type:complete
MAIFLGNRQPQWPVAVKPSTDNMFPHYGQGQGFSYATVLPGFSNDDAAGSALKFNWYGGHSRPTEINYLNKAGTAITDGVWGSGLVPGDVTDANNILGYYMDDTDDLLYLVVQNTGTAPDNLQLVSVNKAGTVGTFSAGWETPSGTSFDGPNEAYKGSLRRVGGDGSGNFELILTKAAPSKDGTSAPHTGCILTFNASTGALTESVLVPDTAIQGQEAYNFSNHAWTTSNNIVASVNGNAPTGAGGTGNYGTLLNKSTGNSRYMCLFPTNDSGAIKLNHTSYYPQGGYWRGYAFISAGGYAGGVSFCNFYNITDLHNMIDEMAVQHGLL